MQIEFKQLFDEYYNRVYKLSVRYIRDSGLAEETAMDIMLLIWKNQHRIAGIENKDGYIFKTAFNAITSALRKKKHQLFSLDELTEKDLNEMTALPVYQEHTKELKKVYQLAVAGLPEKRKQIFILHREEQLTSTQIASLLKISPRTVENQLASALRTIRAAMKNYGITVLPVVAAGLAENLLLQVK